MFRKTDELPFLIHISLNALSAVHGNPLKLNSNTQTRKSSYLSQLMKFPCFILSTHLFQRRASGVKRVYLVVCALLCAGFAHSSRASAATPCRADGLQKPLAFSTPCVYNGSLTYTRMAPLITQDSGPLWISQKLLWAPSVAYFEHPSMFFAGWVICFCILLWLVLWNAQVVWHDNPPVCVWCQLRDVTLTLSQCLVSEQVTENVQINDSHMSSNKAVFLKFLTLLFILFCLFIFF